MCLCYGFLRVGDEVYFDQGVAGGVVFAADDAVVPAGGRSMIMADSFGSGGSLPLA
jgi:hypothetical protein